MKPGHLLLATILAAALPLPAQNLPGWAYGYPTDTVPTGAPPAPAARANRGNGGKGKAAPDESLKHIAGSDQAFTLAQIRDGFGPADWFPGDHPAMPEIVAKGRRPEITACALCHLPNGKGRPENAPVSGYPVAYFIQQMNDFRSGDRASGDARKANATRMAGFAKAMTDEEIKAAAEYFGAIKWTPWVKVVETATVPKTRTAGGLFIALEGDEKEPIGDRIIEVPQDPEQSETYRNPRSGFVAYVPVGSLKQGESLVKTGAGKTTQCAACHGADLKGLGPVPGIVGRSPSYMGRQLYDMRLGSRKGQWTQLMKPVVEKLSDHDILAITAYLASVAP